MPRHYQVNDLSGQVFGRLTVIGYEQLGRHRWGWRCRCECGNERAYAASSLTMGATRSCGCLQVELTKERNRTHGLSKQRVHRIWCAMKTRCSNSNARHFDKYGGRGVKVCQRWADSFEAFLEDMGQPPSGRHSLDRFPDKDGDYCPENCRWATDSEQQRNKRNNHVLEFQGQAKTAAEWAELTGIHFQTILYRLKAGWTVEETLSRTPDKWAYRNRSS